MPNIINNTYFINDLYIPLGNGTVSGLPVNTSTPSNSVALADTITEVEKELSINAFGLTLYDLLQTALIDIDSADARFQILVKGGDYILNSKTYRWEGLNSPKSLICYAIYYDFLSNNSSFYNSIGVTKPNSENASNVNPNYKLATAWQTFLRKYQGGCLAEPFCYQDSGVHFIDYYGTNENQIRSLFQFLNDNASDYPEWTNTDFRLYESINTFGL